MLIYADLVLLLNFAVDLLLLQGADRLAGHRTPPGRCVAAAGLGSVYAGACLLKSCAFLSGTFWRIAVLALMGAVAYGRSGSAVRRSLLFVLLSLALGGGAMLMGGGVVLPGAVVLFVICAIGAGATAGQRFLPVCVTYMGKTERFFALVDTGNSLVDPVSGEGVLVVAPGVAMRLLGLTDEQLNQPVQTVLSGAVPGLRLIPYRSVGGSGLLLAMEFRQVQVGKTAGSRILGFSPNGFGKGAQFQALSGGF